MGIETAIAGAGTLISAGTSVYGALSSKSSTSSSGDVAGEMTSLILNQNLANLEAESTETISNYKASLIEMSAEAQSSVYDYNAAMYDYSAEQARTQGDLQAEAEHRTFAQTEASARTAYAASGVTVETGSTSSGDVAASNQARYYMRRDLIKYGAEITATNYENMATLAEYQSGVTEWLGNYQSQLTKMEGSISAATTKASAATSGYAQAYSAYSKSVLADSAASSQAQTSLLSGLSNAASTLASGSKALSSAAGWLSGSSNGYINVSGGTNYASTSSAADWYSSWL